MYSILLAVHSLMRWFVLLSLVISVYQSFTGWKYSKTYGAISDRIRLVTVTLALLQLTIGVWLYSISAVVDYFLKNFSAAVHMREIRFFGMEHVTMMFIAVVILIIGSVKVKRAMGDEEKFKTMFQWFSIVLLIIFLSIPWSFSPFTSRPLFRSF